MTLPRATRSPKNKRAKERVGGMGMGGYVRLIREEGSGTIKLPSGIRYLELYGWTNCPFSSL